MLGKTCRIRLHGVLALFLLAAGMMLVSCATNREGCSEKQIDENESVSEQLACIYDLLNAPNRVLAPELLKSESITFRAAMSSLLESGYLAKVETLNPEVGPPTTDRVVTAYYPTAEGMEFLYKHKHPVRFWWKKHWFALLIAGANVTIGTCTVLIAWVALRKSRAGNSQR